MDRIVEITHKYKSSHLGSCITTYPILDYIYSIKSPNDVCILSSGHGGLAHYVILEQYENKNAEYLYKKHGIHPHRDIENGIHVSSGSLGSAITVAVGYAIANPKRMTHVIISDGECGEGSVWEALRYSRHLKNLKIHVNINGYSAYDTINILELCIKIKIFNWKNTILWFTRCPFIGGIKAHYHVMTDDDKDKILKNINEKTVCGYSIPYYAKRFTDYFINRGFRLWNS
jgi:transketolase